jgi:putative effector of murein hydrolase LrgA (UPF0299 family)
MKTIDGIILISLLALLLVPATVELMLQAKQY